MAQIGLQSLKDRVYEVGHAVNGNLTKADADRAVKCVLEEITTAMANGDTVILPGFGSFNVVAKQEREGNNPRTKEKMIIPAHKTVKFKAGKHLKEAVNK